MVDSASPLQTLASVIALLTDCCLPYALIGGLAVSVRGEVRFTHDIDLAISVDDDQQAEGVVRHFQQRGYRLVATVEQDRVGRLATARLEAPSGVPVDLVFATSGIERELTQAATAVRLPEAGRVLVARAEDLVAMKVLSASPRRWQDMQDIEGLLRANPDLDANLVCQRLSKMEARGFHRGQDLLAKFESLRRDLG